MACGPRQGAARCSAAGLLESVSPTGKEDDPDRRGPPVGGREEREEGAEMGRKQEELGRREENWAGRKWAKGEEKEKRKGRGDWAGPKQKRRKRGREKGKVFLFFLNKEHTQFI